MFAYRALNEHDLSALELYHSIFAQNPSLNEFMSQLIPHISKGSNAGQKDCWISACKDFMACATEYAIPQNGKYNTVRDTKPIVVIDLDAWLHFEADDYVRNYTVFLDEKQQEITGLRLGDLVMYPLPRYPEGKNSGSRYLNNSKKPYNRKDLNKYSEKFITTLRMKLGNIRYGIMDCSMPKINSPIRAVQELSVYNFPTTTNVGKGVHLAGWVPGAGSNMEKGPAVKATEILFLRCIPSKLIKAVLSHFVQALLSMIEQEHVRNAVLQAIIDKRIIIKECFNESYVDESYVEVIHNGQSHYVPLNRKELFLKPLIDFLDADDSARLEAQYEALTKQKSDMVRKVLKEIMLLLYGQTGALINGKIPEDCGIQVREISAQKDDNAPIGGEEKYDILAIRYEGNIYRYQEALEKLLELAKHKIVEIG